MSKDGQNNQDAHEQKASESVVLNSVRLLALLQPTQNICIAVIRDLKDSKRHMAQKEVFINTHQVLSQLLTEHTELLDAQ